ncbi:MAG: universal stress protein [Halobacteriales archaeon]
MTVLAAIDQEHRTNPVIEIGYDLATAHDEPLVVLHVVPEAEFAQHQQAVTELPGQSDFSFTQEAESAAQFARTIVENTLEEFDSSQVSTIGRVGDPVEKILAAAEEIDARYLVTGGRRRSPAGKAVFGNKTQSILLESTLPVMTVMLD